MVRINRVEYTIDGDSVDNPKYVWESAESSGVIQFKGKTNDGLGGADIIDIVGDYVQSSDIPHEEKVSMFNLLVEVQRMLVKNGL